MRIGDVLKSHNIGGSNKFKKGKDIDISIGVEKTLVEYELILDITGSGRGYIKVAFDGGYAYYNNRSTNLLNKVDLNTREKIWSSNIDADVNADKGIIIIGDWGYFINSTSSHF